MKFSLNNGFRHSELILEKGIEVMTKYSGYIDDSSKRIR
jgi:hypothetical protein